MHLFKVADASVAGGTNGLRTGSRRLVFQMGHEFHDPPCWPQCQGWKTQMRTNCGRSPLNQTALTCTMSPSLTWCTQLWKAWRGLSAPGWKNRTGRSKVKRGTEGGHSVHVDITLPKSLSWIMKILLIFHVDFLNRAFYSPKTWIIRVEREYTDIPLREE